jgi:CRISPR system Cascade subunit CasC
MLIELHMLQNFAPSNLNRDDTNTPKDCEFGGVRRARISSQCLKRAIRWSPAFRQTTQVENGIRTRWITKRFIEELQKNGKSLDEAAKLANDWAAAYAGKMEKDKKSNLPYTSVLIYYSPEEISLLVAGLIDGKPIAEIAKEMVKLSNNRTSAPDIALFGRMLANDPRLNLDAACQVAHAISTHRVNMDMDFFTAVDDLNSDEVTGAGMMGVLAFNSACFYRYACVDWDKLLENLDGDVDLAKRTIEGFLRASVAAIPSGKQNSSAAQNMPSFLLAVVRHNGQAFSLANAFETPITPKREGGYVLASTQKLEEYWQAIGKVFGTKGVTPVALAIDPTIDLTVLKPAASESLEDWIASITQAMEAK